MTVTLLHFIILSFFLFSIGVAGLFINQRNLILILMSLEIMLLSINLLFVAVARYTGTLSGEIFSLVILAVAAAEAAVGLAILVIIYRKYKDISVTQLKDLKG